MKQREGDPWIPAATLGAQLKAVGINLLVEEIARSIMFQKQVLCAKVLYEDPDFAFLEAQGSQWMVHAFHTYENHPFAQYSRNNRGGGIELRVYGCDPDQAAANAGDVGGVVLCAPQDKPHGLREAYIQCPDGYVWVPSLAIGPNV
jgi:hypothetical protein